MTLAALSLLSTGNQAAFLMNDLSTPAGFILDISSQINYGRYEEVPLIYKKTSPFHNVGTGDQNGGLKQQLLCFLLPSSPQLPSFV